MPKDGVRTWAFGGNGLGRFENGLVGLIKTIFPSVQGYSALALRVFKPADFDD